MSRSKSIRLTVDERWNAVVRRDRAANGRFVYAVRSTGVYCRPGCPSRVPNRSNAVFFDSAAEAERAGFRACRRCRPNESLPADPSSDQIIRACRFIDGAENCPRLSEIADHLHVTPHQLHRLFRQRLGITPKQYASVRRAERLKHRLADGERVTQAILSAGFGSNGRCYAQAASILGMTPKQYQNQGKDALVRFATAPCRLGRVLVAVTERGICEIALGDSDAALRAELLARLPAAKQIKPDKPLSQLLSAVVNSIESPAAGTTLPLDIRGTAFQQRVWFALQAIPPGQTLTYSQLAAAIGQPRAVRAVGSACAANRLAVAVPCHRIVKSDGRPGWFRWGTSRKKALIEAEYRSTNTQRDSDK